jgi:glyoxylase-like metal-dependent hydrolase (beta-lactamase superfamily II)
MGLDYPEQEGAMNIHSLTLGFVQAYLIETPGGLVLIDCGMPHQEERILRAVEQTGRGDLKLIFITHAHADHYGSAAALQRLTGAPVAVHRADAPAMAGGKTPIRGAGRLARAATSLFLRISPTPPVEADLLLDDGDSLARYGLPGTVVHTPGHSAGSSCLLLEDGTGFLGDMLSAGKEPHLQRTFVEDWDQLRRSYARLRELPLSRVYAGHGSRILTGDELGRLIDAEIGAAGTRP